MAANATLWPTCEHLPNRTVAVNQGAATATIIAAPAAGSRIVVCDVHGAVSGTIRFKSGASGTVVFECDPTDRPLAFSNKQGLFNCDAATLLELTSSGAKTDVVINYKIVDDASYVDA